MIKFVCDPLIVLAAREKMHRVWGRFDHERPGITTNQVLIGTAIIAAVILAVIVSRIVARRSKRAYLSNSPAKLFRELCAAHGLSLRSRRLLRRLAEFRGVASPAMLFVEPQHFETKNLSAELKASAHELRQLRTQLFDA